MEIPYTIDKGKAYLSHTDGMWRVIWKGIPINADTPDRRRAEAMAKHYKLKLAEGIIWTENGWVRDIQGNPPMSPKDNLVKELNRLQRQLNSRRLGTYMIGDTSEAEMARQRERNSKLARFNEIRRILNANPPMYAHHLRERKTHGLSLKQMRRLYAMVSRGSQKAITFARNVLGIPFDETPSQVKAIVRHHLIDLGGRRVRGNRAGKVTEGEIRQMYKRMGQVMYRKTGLYGPYHAISQYGYTLMDRLPTRKSAEDYVIRFYKSKSPSIIRG